MENKKGFYDEIYENYKNLSLVEVEELLLRCNEEEKESFIRMLEKCCLKRDLKKELIREEIQDKEKIEQNYKEYEEKLLSFIEKMVLMVAGYISFTLTGFNLWKIRVSGILGIPLVMVLGALFLKRVMRYKFYKNKYEKNFLENKMLRVYCDGLIESSVLTLGIFAMLYFLGYIICSSKIAIIFTGIFVLIYCIIRLFILKWYLRIGRRKLWLKMLKK